MKIEAKSIRDAQDDPRNYEIRIWVNGSLDKNPAGMRLAGRVGKGAGAGCIACHAGAGEAMIFTTTAAVPGLL